MTENQGEERRSWQVLNSISSEDEMSSQTERQEVFLFFSFRSHSHLEKKMNTRIIFVSNIAVIPSSSSFDLLLNTSLLLDFLFFSVRKKEKRMSKE
jgi:hypothetical protein